MVTGKYRVLAVYTRPGSARLLLRVTAERCCCVSMSLKADEASLKSIFPQHNKTNSVASRGIQYSLLIQFLN
uniref:Uncharacterized protein n=1 Tax=Anguilla anguilla TaxID=7936 RepID=A0A0E9TIQ9_ANGAN